MRRPKVVVTDFIGGALQEELEILGDIADVEALAAQSENDLIGRIEEADAIMVYHCISITARTIETLRQCKLIVRCGVGYDNVDGPAARKKGIPLANVPDYGTEEVADSAIAMTLSLMRGVNFFNRRLQAGKGEWSYVTLRPLHRLRGQVFGIIGLGRIGTAAALRAKALGFDVVFFDPYVPDGRDKSLGVRRMESLEELLQAAHIVSTHCPLTPETKHIINAKSVQLMRRGAFVVNTARGGVVDVSCLPDAIASGQLGGAGIDVLETEPPPDDHPVIRAWRDPEHPAHERLILNPHAAFYCEEGLNEMRVKGSQNCRRALLGERIRNVVN